MTNSMLIKLLSKYTYSTPNAQILSPHLLQTVKLRRPLLEIKQTINQQEKSFQLQNWHHSPEVCVGRWVPSLQQSYNMPLGSYSWGVWRKELGIGAYRIHDPYGNLVAYRFDILKDPRMISTESHDVIHFRDLIVDLWLWPTLEGTIRPEEIQIEDFEEFDMMQRSEMILPHDAILVKKILLDVTNDVHRYTRIVDESINFAVSSRGREGSS